MMKSPAMIIGALLFGVVLSPAQAAGPGETEAVPAAFKAHPGPVAELRNQDSAFSLLIETYRQMQSFMIEGDYDKRIRAASLVKDAKEREHIATLAAQERDLRLAKLSGTLEGFSAAYGTSRQGAEKNAGVRVPSAIDAKAADDKLRTLVPFTPHDFGPGENQPSHLLPAGAQMIYSQRR